MKYLKRILEAFDFKSWKWIVTQDDSYQAEFTYDSIKYQCHVTKIVESKGVWEINFFRIDEKFNVIMTITGNSKAPTKIFSNVISITEAFIEKASPSIVIWKSIDNDRTFLYTKFGE